MRLKAKKLREALGKTQAEMSAATGMSQATISKVENGAQNTTLKTLEKAAIYLGVTVRDLFESDSPKWVDGIVNVILDYSDAEQKEALGFLSYLSQRNASAKAPEESQ